MVRRKIKFIAVLLIACLCVSILSVSALAVEEWDDPCYSANYKDVDKSAWYHQAVDYVLKNGIMAGTAANTFEPTSPVTRAMAVQVLYALAGKPEVTSDAGFTDLTATWYKDAVNWAVANKLAAGYGNGKFGPDDYVTREQMATIFQAAANYCRIDTSRRADLSGYEDQGQISSWAYEKIQWAVAVGLISSTSSDKLLVDPQGTLTRAQLAQMLYRFHSGSIGTPVAAVVESISAVYDGSTEHGTVLDSNNEGIKVIAKCTDGSMFYLTDWTIATPATLTAGKTSTVIITCGGFSCNLSVECTTDPAVVYEKESVEVTYDDLVNNPDKYTSGQIIKIQGRIRTTPVTGPSGIHHMIAKDSEGNYDPERDVLLNITYEDGQTALKNSQVVTIYGRFQGLNKISAYNYPVINVDYFVVES